MNRLGLWRCTDSTVMIGATRARAYQECMFLKNFPTPIVLMVEDLSALSQKKRRAPLARSCDYFIGFALLGLRNIGAFITIHAGLGVPYCNYCIMGPKTLF